MLFCPRCNIFQFSFYGISSLQKGHNQWEECSEWLTKRQQDKINSAHGLLMILLDFQVPKNTNL